MLAAPHRRIDASAYATVNFKNAAFHRGPRLHWRGGGLHRDALIKRCREIAVQLGVPSANAKAAAWQCYWTMVTRKANQLHEENKTLVRCGLAPPTRPGAEAALIEFLTRASPSVRDCMITSTTRSYVPVYGGPPENKFTEPLAPVLSPDPTPQP
jgi:hypothetical protein